MTTTHFCNQAYHTWNGTEGPAHTLCGKLVPHTWGSEEYIHRDTYAKASLCRFLDEDDMSDVQFHCVKKVTCELCLLVGLGEGLSHLMSKEQETHE